MTIRIYFAILFASSVLGQTVESPAAFEVASVKLSAGGGLHYNVNPGGLEVRNLALKVLIGQAYRVSFYALSGPDWLDSVNLDIDAKLPASAADLSRQERNLMTSIMLQGLLAERFKLKVHREEKAIPGYALVIAPGGPKTRRVEATQPSRLRKNLLSGVTAEMF